jgi:hypothetical protein
MGRPRGGACARGLGRVGRLASEQVSVADQRRTAIATSNSAAIAAAFAQRDDRHSRFGFELLLLEARSCGGPTA